MDLCSRPRVLPVQGGEIDSLNHRIIAASRLLVLEAIFMLHRFHWLPFAFLGLVWPVPAPAARVLLDVNQFAGPYDDASLVRLRGDGIFGVLGGQIPDAKLRNVMAVLGNAWTVTEDMHPKTDFYDLAKRRYAKTGAAAVNGVFSYNETGGAPGGTVLTDDQIGALAAKLGPDRDRIVVLTRAYTDDWKPAVDRALRNPRVAGVCLETVSDQPPAHMDGARVKALIQAILAQKKQFYLLAPRNKNPVSYAESLKGYLTRLHESGVDLSDDNIVLIAADYDHGNVAGGFYAAGNRPGDSVESAVALYNHVARFPGEPAKWAWDKNPGPAVRTKPKKSVKAPSKGVSPPIK